MRQPFAVIASPVTWVGVFFVALLLGMPELRPGFEWGFPGVSPAVFELDSFFGMGLSPWQLLRDVELPLAAPVILAGVRVSVTIAIGTATIGSTVGALTLGTPIFDGLAANKLPFVLQGAVLIALFAIVTDMLFARLERRLQVPLAR